MGNYIDTVISGLALIVAILDFVRGCRKDLSPTNTQPQNAINNIYILETSAHPTPPGYIKNRWLGKATFIILFSFVFCAIGILYFSVKPISSTLALFHILVVIIVVYITLRAQSRIGWNYHLLYLLCLFAIMAIIRHFSTIEAAVPFLSFEINKAYLYFVMIIALACFSWLTNYMLSAAYGYPISKKYFLSLAGMLIMLAALLTGLFEKTINTVLSLILLWADRFFHM